MSLNVGENKIAGKGFVAMGTVGWVQLEEVDISTISFECRMEQFDRGR